MFGDITQLYQDSNWFSYDAPNPCNHSWEFTECTHDEKQNKYRVSSIGGFNKVGEITQLINTTYWPQKLTQFDCHTAYFGGILNFDNISNETIKIRIFKCNQLKINLTNMRDLSNFNII